MKQHSLFSIPIKSFYSKSLYYDVFYNWRGVCFGYLFLLLALLWIPTTVIWQNSWAKAVNKDAPAFVEQIPEITFENGKASIEEEQPYYIYAPEDTEQATPLVIIDTTGQFTSLKDTEAFGLLTESEFMFRNDNEIKTESYDLSEIENFVLNQDLINSWIGKSKKLVAPVTYPFVLIGSYIARIIQVLIYGLIGLAFAAMMTAPKNYGALVRLSVVAMTPAMIIRAALGWVGISFPLQGFVYFLLAMAFLLAGVGACKYQR